MGNRHCREVSDRNTSPIIKHPRTTDSNNTENEEDDVKFDNVKRACYYIAFDIDMDKEYEESKYWHVLASSERHEKDELYKELDNWNKDWRKLFREKYQLNV